MKFLILACALILGPAAALADEGSRPTSSDQPAKIQQHNNAVSSTGYAFSPKDSSIETRLCYAAVTSADEFEAIRSKHFSSANNLDKVVECNGMPLSRFVEKYRSKRYVSSTL